MKCKNCNVSKVCSIFNMKLENLNEIEVNITSCKYYSKSNSSNSSISALNNNCTTSIVNYSNSPNISKSVVTETKKEIDKTIVTCKTCKCTDYKEYIDICSSCGKETCGSCATGYIGLTYCEECWKTVGNEDNALSQEDIDLIENMEVLIDEKND